MRRHLDLTFCTLAVAGMFGVGQAHAQPARKPAAAPADSPLARCVTANRQALIDIDQGLESARRRHVTSPLVITRLQALQVQLTKVKEAQPRSARGLADCEAATEAIATERDRLGKIAGPDPDAADCIAQSQKMHTASLQGWEAVQRSGKLAADQATAFEAAGQRLNSLSAALARDAMFVHECRQIAAQVAQERVQVERWLAASGAALAAPPPAAPPSPAPAPPPASTPAAPPEVCRTEQARQYNELAQTFAAVAQAGPMAPEKLTLFQGLSDRLTKLRALIADRNAPGWDCNGVNRGLAQVKAELQPLAAK